MTNTLTIGEFISHNPGFVFHLPVYIESTRYFGQAQKKFDSFRRSFSVVPRSGSSWQTKRMAFKRAVCDIKAYDSIDWARSKYWETIPFIDKDSIRSRPNDFLSPRYDPTRLWLRPTSGTTGPPVQIWYASEFYFDFILFSTCKIAWLAGALADQPCRRPVFCFAVFDNKYLSESVWACPENFLGFTLLLIFDEREPSSITRLTSLLESHRPEVLTLKPNILDSIVRSKDGHCKTAASHLRLIISGGADLGENLREAGQRYLSVPICNAYGLTEVGVVASECIYRDGLHVYEHEVVPEIIQNDGRVQEVGAGELVLSSVANPAMPFLRYKTGDIVELTSDPCKCGRRGRRIRRISGRIIRNFRLSDGSEFSPTNFNRELFVRFPIREFRLTQTQVSRIQAEVEFLPSCQNPMEEVALIRKHIENEMRFLVQVDASQVVFKRDSKFQRFRVAV